MVSGVGREKWSIKMLFCRKLIYRRTIRANYILISKAPEKIIISTYYYQNHFYTLSSQLYNYMEKLRVYAKIFIVITLNSGIYILLSSLCFLSCLRFL